MTNVHRRSFLLDAARLTGASLIAPSVLGLAACNRDGTTTPVSPLPRARKGDGGYGELIPHPSLPFLIPAGFQLKQISRSGGPMARAGAGPVPNALDGMGALLLNGGGKALGNTRGAGSTIRLVRNHEIRDGAGRAPVLGTRPYDPTAGAGCTSLEVEIDKSGEPQLVDEFVSIGGTWVNCAGGITPWGSWITSEETTAGPRQGFAKKHGYNFEVPGGATSEVEAVPLVEMGRFSHEAIAVDPVYGHVYQTEDAGNTSGFYRFLPTQRRELAMGGRLQMLAITGRPKADTTKRNADPANRFDAQPLVAYDAHWVDVDNPDPDLESGAASVFAQGLAAGGARFARLEGCWWGDGSVFYNATSGGAVGAGQVWQYRPRTADEGELILLFESPSTAVLDAPDNICVSPRGGLVLCEDGGGTQFMRGLTQQGHIFDLVRAADPVDATEFAGACFDPHGDFLFFNTQGSTAAAGTERGGTFAMWGPWKEGAL